MIPPGLKITLERERLLQLNLKVVPKASSDEVVGWLEEGILKVKVTAGPDKGKANAAVCELLAEAFGVPKRNVEIVRGYASTSKLVRIIA